MTLQSSGPIKSSEIQGEFGGTNPVSLSEYYGVDDGVPTSGRIRHSDFYGTSDAPPLAPPGSQTFTSSGTFTVPSGYTEVTICMCGGGGSGEAEQDEGGGRSSGGHAGQIISQTVSGLTSGQQIPVVIGAGGARSVALRNSNIGRTVAGKRGGDSKFGTVTASGGAGGAWNNSFSGNGEARTTCGGTYNNGFSDSSTYGDGDRGTGRGGEAGAFGNGGKGSDDERATGYTAGTGGVGAGGGGCHTESDDATSGAGGRGQCIVSWG